MSRIYETTTIARGSPFGIAKAEVWLDADRHWFVKTPAGHIGVPDRDQLMGMVSLVCTEEGCDEHFTILSNGHIERLLEVGEL